MLSTTEGNTEILQIWHINKSPAFQAKGHKAVTFLINLGLLYILTFWHIHTGVIQSVHFSEIHINRLCNSFRRQHHNNPYNNRPLCETWKPFSRTTSLLHLITSITLYFSRGFPSYLFPECGGG